MIEWFDDLVLGMRFKSPVCPGIYFNLMHDRCITYTHRRCDPGRLTEGVLCPTGHDRRLGHEQTAHTLHSAWRRAVLL